jgi:ABC-type nitrate/sulfonate/bicarbonate transport system substrate-binding protein
MAIKLDYGVPTDRSGINVRFGAAKGFFADEGIDLNVKVVFGGPEIAAAYHSGDLKIGELGSPPGITAIARGHRFRIIGSGLQRGVSLFFLLSPEIASWDDLKGKTLGALSRGSCSYWYLRELLSQHGVDPDEDVRIRGLGPDYPRQLELFERGEIAGLLSAEPNGALGEYRGIVKSWGDVFSLADVPKLQWVIQVANQDFLTREPALVRAVLRATLRSSRYLAENRDEWIEFAAKHFKVPWGVAKTALAREQPFFQFDGRLDEDGLRNAIDLQHYLGAIGDRLPISAFVAEDFKLAA